MLFLRRGSVTVILSLLTACAAPPPQPTLAPTSTTRPPSVTPQPTPSATPATTQTPRPTATLVASATPSGLRSGGPYLVALDGEPGRQSLVAFDQDGGGRKRLDLPQGYTVPDVVHGLSPDGAWLVMYAGTAEGAQGPFDLHIGLYDLVQGELKYETALLDPNYPASLPNGGANGGRGAFVAGIRAFAWSPNARYLAFAGQIDGPSSDLYLLDVQTGQRRRLTDGAEHIVHIEWSPDGRRVLNTSAGRVDPAGAQHVWVADAASESVLGFGSVADGAFTWIDAATLLIEDGPVGDFPHSRAHIADLLTGSDVRVWGAGYGRLWLDWPARRASLVGCPSAVVDPAACGQFTVDLIAGTSNLDEALADVYGWPPHPTGEESSGDLLLEDRAGNRLSVFSDRIVLSPNASGASLTFARTGPIMLTVQAFSLAPDRRHLFLMQAGRIEVLDLTTDSLRVVLEPHRAGPTEAYLWMDVVPGTGEEIALAPSPTPPGAQHGPSPTPPSVVFVDSLPALGRIPVANDVSAWFEGWASNSEVVLYLSASRDCVEQRYSVVSDATDVTVTALEPAGAPACTWLDQPAPAAPDLAALGFDPERARLAGVTADGSRALVEAASATLAAPIVIGASILNPEYPEYTQAWIVDLATGGRTLISGSAGWLTYAWGEDERYLLVRGGDCYGGNGQPGIFTIDLQTLTLITLDGDHMICEGSVAPAHAPNAPLLAAQDGRVVTYAGEVLVDLCESLGIPRVLEWSADGRFIYGACTPAGYHDGYDTIRRFEPATGDRVDVVSPAQVPVRMVDLSVSPDGRYLAFEWGTNRFMNQEEFGLYVLDTTLLEPKR